jgi:DNA-binding XRE family transcriptional regulator
MGKPQIITSPAGEELVVLPRQDYEDLLDALAACKAHASLLASEELLTSEETVGYVAAPSPLAFWRKKRGLTEEALAAQTGVSPSVISDVESRKAQGDVTLYVRLAKRLGLTVEDLVADED